MLLLIFAGLATGTSRGQSLSIIKKGESNFWIQASAPAADPYTLQASANLHLWADIHDPVQGDYSNQLGGMSASQRYFRLVPSSPPGDPIIVVMIGDSMTADCCGWGQGMYEYFKPNATLVNYAMPATSTKVFLQSAERDEMLLVKPDYVLIQFGYSDQVYAADTNINTTLQEFGDNLRTIVQSVRDFGGVPILVTLHAGRYWDANGQLTPTWQERNAVTREVAAELQTPLVDLYQLSVELFNQLGPSGTAFMQWAPGGPTDGMHMSPAGAVVIARLVVNALPDNFGPYLTGIFDPPPLQ